jgi:hypothetical protein
VQTNKKFSVSGFCLSIRAMTPNGLQAVSSRTPRQLNFPHADFLAFIEPDDGFALRYFISLTD